MVNEADFAEASGYLRAIEKRMMPRAAIERVADATLDETLSVLSQYFDFSGKDYEAALSAELRRAYETARDVSPSGDIVDALGAKYDFHNIKTAVKARFAGTKDRPYVNVTDVAPEDVERFVFGGVEGDLPSYVISACKEALAAFELSNDPMAIDVTLDRLMFARMVELCEKIDSVFISDYVKTLIDFYNIEALIRIKRMNKGVIFAQAALVNGGFADAEQIAAQYAKPLEVMAEELRYGPVGYFVSVAAEKGLSELEKAR
ncbi:MAG: V-type ATPase subunit, partial [Clostridiales bacterium]|nr:V-type ATPase subunit [Clostridiales bacterium]